jgi:hypothetical protein
MAASVIVNDLDVVRIPVLPAEADPPLIIDADAVLTSPIPFELLEAVPGRHPKIGELFGRVDRDQLPEHRALERRRVAADGLTAEQARRVSVAKAVDHTE